MSLPFRSKTVGGKVHLDREAYIRKRIQRNDDSKTVCTDRHMLCNAIARANHQFTPNSDKQPVELSKPKSARKPLPPYFPWLTLVLGSGCVTETVDATSLSPINPASIKASLSGRGGLTDGEGYDELAMQFACELISDRTAAVGSVRVAAPGALPDTGPALLVLATALLTYLYRETAASGRRPLAPRGNDRVHVTEKTIQRHGELRTLYCEPLKTVIHQLIAPRPTNAVDHVLKRILTGLQKAEPTIARLDVQILTEFCWLKLIEQSPVYHGWTDLLSALARHDIEEPTEPHSYPLRPPFDSSGTMLFINDSYSHVTTASWNDRQGKELSPVHLFFDTVSSVLHEQSVLRGQYDRAIKPPVVSVFSTSFDLELEMALTSKSELDGFVVAVPVNCVQMDDETATLHWLGAIIDRPRKLEDIQRPKNWVLLSGRSWNDIWGVDNGKYKRFADLPVVVRLAGCPLITLPDVESVKALARAADVTLPEFSKLERAILLDEYGAIQHHSTEMFAPAPQKQSQGLPEQLTWKSQKGEQNRFWMVMGVQMDDAAIRFRVATRLGDGRKGPDGDRPDRAGIVVTHNVAPAARDLMPWFGVDVVQARCADFIPDLDHYVAHLKDAEPWRADHYSEPCRLKVDK